MKLLIYAWVRDDLKRTYVGQSATGMNRPNQHAAYARRGKWGYIQDALWRDGTPELRILEEVLSIDLLDEREWAWMSLMRADGYDVINRLPEGVRWGTREGRSIGGRISGALHGPQGGKTTAAKLGPEGCRARGSKGGTAAVANGSARKRWYARTEENRHEIVVKGGQAQAAKRRQCSCGYVAAPWNVGKHQKRLGHVGFEDLDT